MCLLPGRRAAVLARVGRAPPFGRRYARRRRPRAVAAASVFSNLRLVWRGKSYYATGAAEKEIAAGRHGGRNSERRQRSRLRISPRGVDESGTGDQAASLGSLAHRAGFGRARNRVDVIYHSDSLYSAVTSAHGEAGIAGRVAGRHGAERGAGGVLQFVLSPFWMRSRSSCRRVPSGRPPHRR